MKGIYMVLLLGGWCGDHAAMAQEPRAGFRVDNPYAHVDWDGVLRIGSTTHVHVQDQKELEQAYVGMGLRHLPISNYYPSVPYYPVDSLRMGQFRVSQDIEVQFKPPGAEQPQALKETIHWNTLIMDPESGWYDQLPEELQQELPFEAGELAFTDVPVDILINNAGIGFVKLIEDMTEEEYRMEIDINQVSIFLGMKAVLPSMKKTKNGSIVNISSVAGLIALPQYVAYSGSKFAVRGMTKVAALEFAPYGIRVNSVHPGLIDTPMTQDEANAASLAEFAKSIPLGRAAQPEEVTNLVLFLASEDSSYSTGSEFVIDGGNTPF